MNDRAPSHLISLEDVPRTREWLAVGGGFVGWRWRFKTSAHKPLTAEEKFENEQHRLNRRVYVNFAISFAVATAWVSLSIWLSLRWVEDLTVLVGEIFALLVIGFIAYVPGFMNFFMISTLLLERQSPVRAVTDHPGVTVLVAAYNEAAGIAATLTSLAKQNYPGSFQVLILNDGSKDNTADIVREMLGKLHIPPNASFQLMDFERNRGKSAVLNDGLRAASHDLIATVDGDCWVRRDGLTNIVERLVSDTVNTQAVAGAVVVRNANTNLLTRTQEWDYFHGIAAVKRTQSMYHGTLVAQGAFSLYRREALEDIGGWPEKVGEDIVVTWAMLIRGHRIGYAANAFAFTNVPENFRQFALQRKRWSRGLMEAFKLYWPLLFKKRMTTLFIWWNLLFPPMDLIYTFAFIPGIILALCGYFWIAGPMTLAIMPFAVIWNGIVFRTQKNEFMRAGLKVHRNRRGFFCYAFIYSLLMQPVCVWGYMAELIGLRKAWDTK
ncbi:MAG: glycosyltransferase family 2 protein [Methylobacillus sp.]|jgi:biofilm PGA synthesis N-glycosyltransferase PgaC|nr:glycosyltransferase family 2 protein [Methylobacillus sp.]